MNFFLYAVKMFQKATTSISLNNLIIDDVKIIIHTYILNIKPHGSHL